MGLEELDRRTNHIKVADKHGKRNDKQPEFSKRSQQNRELTIPSSFKEGLVAVVSLSSRQSKYLIRPVKLTVELVPIIDQGVQDATRLVLNVLR